MDEEPFPIIKAHLSRAKIAPPPTFPPDRTCTVPDCRTRLSRYNGETLCYIHTPRRRSVRPSR